MSIWVCDASPILGYRRLVLSSKFCILSFHSSVACDALGASTDIRAEEFLLILLASDVGDADRLWLDEAPALAVVFEGADELPMPVELVCPDCTDVDTEVATVCEHE